MMTSPQPASADLDACMMVAAKAGDALAFEILIRKHRVRVVHFVNRIVRNHAASEELAQEVFLRVYRHRDDYVPTAKFSTWVFTIAGRLALNWRRDSLRRRCEPLEFRHEGERVHRQFEDPAISADERLVAQSRRAAVRHAISNLPERQRRIVVLHKFEGMSCEEIAALSGCTNQAVRSVLVRAYASLRDQLSGLDC